MDNTSPSLPPLGEELRGDAERAAGAAAGRLEAEANNRKGAIAGQAQQVSSALGTAARELGSEAPTWLRSALEQGARTIEELARTVDQKDSRELVGEVQRFARERPGTFLAGCAFAGFAAARVFKAGASASSAAAGSQGQQMAHEPYAASASSRPIMPFTDGGGTASPVTPENLGSSL